MPFELPMFPLGSVLFPFTAVPLRVFESRYQTLVDTCLAGDGMFGTVLIERGSEVGGGDTRFQVGTIARLAGETDLEEGHRLILAVGTGRLEVVDWLPDDPYPRALVEQRDEPDESAIDLPLDPAKQKLRKALALMSEVGYDVGAVDLKISEDPHVAVHQLCALAPVSPLDAHELLRIDQPSDRLNHLQALLDDEIALLQQQLAGG
jgi:Lon protease-like protein